MGFLSRRLQKLQVSPASPDSLRLLKCLLEINFINLSLLILVLLRLHPAMLHMPLSGLAFIKNNIYRDSV